MRIVSKLLVGALVVVGMAWNASAILLTPGNAGWYGSIPNNPNADGVEAITGTSAQLWVVYKDDQGVGDAESVFSNFYKTEYFNTPTDPKDATITYTGGTSISGSGSPIYLLVKGGNQDPGWYIYDISGWNGTETIQLQNFWPGPGAISHVTILTGVPDASSTMMLLGMGIVAVEGLRRRLTK